MNVGMLYAYICIPPVEVYRSKEGSKRVASYNEISSSLKRKFCHKLKHRVF